MIELHEASDDAILKGRGYFEEWRKSRNALLLFDVVTKLDAAERLWVADKGRGEPMRREWQVLCRWTMRALARLRGPLLAAKTPAQTERALYAGGKRATLARIGQLNARAVTIALTGSTFEQAAATLKDWGIPRKKNYLKKRASELGLTKRKTPRPSAPRTSRKWPTQPAQSPKTIEVAPGRRRRHGDRY